MESRMNRLEMGIFTALVAVVVSMGGLLYTVWDLPAQIRADITASRYEGGP